MKQYRITGANKHYQRSNYQIQKRSWYWPFWVDFTDYTYETVDVAKRVVERLKTDIRL